MRDPESKETSKRTLPQYRTKIQVSKNEESRQIKQNNRIEDPWIRLPSRKKLAKDKEEKAKKRVETLIITSELGNGKPLSHLSRNQEGITVNKTDYSKSRSVLFGAKAMKLALLSHEQLECFLHSKKLHKLYAPSLADYDYAISYFGVPDDKCLYKKYKLPPLC